MKVYISGPISGRHNGNREAFNTAEQLLASHGFQAINPHDIGDALPGPPEAIAWQDYMRADLKAMLDADALFVLDGWNNSRGATIEVTLSRDLGIAVFWRLEDLVLFRTGAYLQERAEA